MLTNQQTVQCPYCNKTMEISGRTDDDVITCENPVCQKVFQLDLPTAKPEGEAPQQADAAPEEDTEATFTHEAESEQVLGVFPTPMATRYPFRFASYLTLTVLGFIGFLVGYFQLYNALWIISALVLALGAGILIAWWWQARSQTVKVTTHGLVLTQGMWQETTREINHNYINEIHIYQPWYCKWFHTGSIMLIWGENRNEEFIEAISRPHEVVQLIRDQGNQ